MAESAKQRHVNAIATAQDYLRRSESAFVRVGAQAATAYALQGILCMQIELLQNSWDAPCDCFAPLPEPFAMDDGG